MCNICIWLQIVECNYNVLILRENRRKFLSQGTYNAVDLLDAHEDSVVDVGIIWKHIGLIFCMGKMWYLTPVCT